MSTTLSREELDARLRLVEEHIRAENAHDVDAIMKTFGQYPNLILNDDFFSGHEDIRAMYEAFGFGGRGGFANLHLEEYRRHISDEAIIFELFLSGEHTDTWQGIHATGRTFKAPLCAVFVFDDDGKLAAERVYLDGALLLRQLGVLP